MHAIRKASARVAICLFLLLAISGCEDEHAPKPAIVLDPKLPPTAPDPTLNHDPQQDFFNIVYPGEMTASEEAKILSIEASGSLRPDPAMAQRVQTELAGIRASYPAKTNFPARPNWHLHHLEIQFDDATAQQVLNNNYKAWDELNQTYGVNYIDLSHVDTPPTWGWRYALIAFDDVLKLPTVAEAYRQLPGITAVHLAGFAADASDICLLLEGSQHTYIFDLAAGDCPAGCTQHDYSYFTADASGNIEALSFGIRSLFPACDNWL